MPKPAHQVIALSPPNLERSGYLDLAGGLTGGADGLSAAWVTARLKEGMQIRMLRGGPARGVIEFCPAGISWRPIAGADGFVVIQCLGAESAGARAVLLQSAEDWARYFGFSALLALVGPHPCLLPVADLKGLGFDVIGDPVGAVQLAGKVLQGPVALPSLPQDWRARLAGQAAGLVVQCTGRMPGDRTLAEALVSEAREAGLPGRVTLLDSPAQARAQAVSPVSPNAVILNRKVISEGPFDGPALRDLLARHAAGSAGGGAT